MTYTRVLEEMVRINNTKERNEMRKNHFLDLVQIYRDFNTIRVSGGRQSGKTHTLVNWLLTNNSVMFAHRRDILRDILNYIDDEVVDSIKGKVFYISEYIRKSRHILPHQMIDGFVDVDYILLDEVDLMPKNEVDLIYEMVASVSNNPNVVFIMT